MKKGGGKKELLAGVAGAPSSCGGSFPCWLMPVSLGSPQSLQLPCGRPGSLLGADAVTILELLDGPSCRKLLCLRLPLGVASVVFPQRSWLSETSGKTQERSSFSQVVINLLTRDILIHLLVTLTLLTGDVSLHFHNKSPATGLSFCKNPSVNYV